MNLDSKFIVGRLAERIDVTDDLAVFRIKPEEACHFIAGQYATLGVVRDGKLIERAYSVASSPYEPLLEFFIELVPDGRLTPSLFDLRAGDTLSVRRRFSGRFVLDTTSKTHHLMAATVTGIAPFTSILRTYAVDAEAGRTAPMTFTVLHGASRSWELGTYRMEMEELQKRVPNLTYVPTISRCMEDSEWRGELGRVGDVLRKHADALPLEESHLSAYLCGHPQMIENARGVLLRSRVAPERIHSEKYFTL